jgi:uncharacterized protein (DUF433 family)
MNYKNRVIADPKVLVGKPVIKGTRIPVELILKMLAEGMEVKEILKGYPRLKKEDILAAVDYAREVVEQEKTYSTV